MDEEIDNSILDLIGDIQDVLLACSKIALFCGDEKDSSYMIREEIGVLKNFIKKIERKGEKKND